MKAWPACARSCYGHLAGVLGVDLCRCLVENGWVQGDAHQYALTTAGAKRVGELGITLNEAPRQLYGCVDWSERRDHFAGPLAVALLDNFIERGWLRRSDDSRVLALTAGGATSLKSWLAQD
ncbi:hypothetical protein [Duganella flavida]|uniref:hypothetical protein n=1 Tax=Duganella flavida TaxID=2692175 RepID=UPI001E47B694|nr:hypothetical protein [Duganella flavida]